MHPSSFLFFFSCNILNFLSKNWRGEIEKINLLLGTVTERESCTGEYWPEVVTVWTERSEVCTKTTEHRDLPRTGFAM